MSPTLKDGDLVLVKASIKDISVGDIALYHHNGVNVKRVATFPAYLESTGDTLFMLGDNSGQSYDSRYYGPISRDDLLGSGILVLRSGRSNQNCDFELL